MHEAELTPSFVPSRKWRIGFSVAVSTVALLAIVLMANFLGARHFWRWQWNASSRFQLSPLSLTVLHSLTNQVNVVVFFDRTKPLHGMVADLLHEYQVSSPNLQVEFVDYMISRGRAEEVQARYQLAAPEAGDRIIFESEGRTRVVYERDLSDFDTAAILEGREVKRTSFKGEQFFTSAIFGVMDSRPFRAYFLGGHGEHSPADKQSAGFSEFARVLEENNVEWAVLTNLFHEDVPADCQLLIVPAPQHALAPPEAERIEKYLTNGGRLLVMLNSNAVRVPTGMERLLLRWGVEVGRNFVMDAAQEAAGDPRVLLVGDFGGHPVVKPLLRSRLLMIQPRSVTSRITARQGANAPKVVELASTSSQGLATDGLTEQRGAIPLMVAVELGGVEGISADQGATRMIVCGESRFLSNAGITQEANRDFARNAVNWLLNRDQLLDGIGPKAIQEFKITMSESELRGVRLLLLGGLPGSVLLLGSVVWFKRRR